MLKFTKLLLDVIPCSLVEMCQNILVFGNVLSGGCFGGLGSFALCCLV